MLVLESIRGHLGSERTVSESLPDNLLDASVMLTNAERDANTTGKFLVYQ